MNYEEIIDVYYGVTPIKRIYRGDTLVWTRESHIEIPYLEFNKTQYINTNIYNSGDYEITQRLLVHTGSNWLFGGRSSTTKSLGVLINDTSSFGGYGGTTQMSSISTPIIDVWLDIVFNRQFYKINDLNLSLGTTSLIPESEQYIIWVAGMNQPEEDIRFLSGLMSSFELKDVTTSEVLIRYKSCILREDVIDEVTGKTLLAGTGCYYNEATGGYKGSDGEPFIIPSFNDQFITSDGNDFVTSDGLLFKVKQ